MATLPAATLPLMALGSLGLTAGSLLSSLFLQNHLARAKYPDIPRTAKPYNNYISRLRGTPETNHTFLGFVAFGMAFGATAVVGRIATQPLQTFLRKKFIYVPGTATPKRIKSFAGLLYDICPEVIVNTLPLVPAFHVGMYFKVMADGPGRFKDWSVQYNPYDSVIKHRAEIFDRPTLPSYALRKIEDDDVYIARGLWEDSSAVSKDEKTRQYELLLQNYAA
jgi:hypothetical protein